MTPNPAIDRPFASDVAACKRPVILFVRFRDKETSVTINLLTVRGILIHRVY